MTKLAETFEWAASTDIKRLRKAVRTAGLSALRAVGSGGSLTAAHALANFHQRFTARMAAVSTPLEAVEEPLEHTVSTWLLSASGGNVDIVAAAKALIEREPRQLAVLCGREDSPLAELCRAHPFVDLLIYPPPAGKDGFLATNSLLGFSALLARAYAAEFGCEAEWVDAMTSLRLLLTEGSSVAEAWEDETKPLWSRPTTLVLYGPSTRIGAIDLESKFTEAALGNLQLADYRNFAHGRHHWLAKRGEMSGVLALITDADRSLAERTLALIPREITQAHLSFSGQACATALSALVAAFRVSGWAGSARGIDPGRPGVPDFGRKLYNLPLPRAARGRNLNGLSPRDAAAIARKAGVAPAHMTAAGELDRWRLALDSFRDGLRAAAFAGVVLDYDGTVVDTRDRFIPAPQPMSAQLERIAAAGIWVAIATGRGASVRRDLRARIPKTLWDRILVGYYNGAEIALLNDDDAPDGSEGTCAALAPLAAALRNQPELAQLARQTERRYQITLEGTRVMPESRLWDLARQVIIMTGTADVTVTRSSHSVDIVAAGVSKLSVVTQLRNLVGTAPVLAIGDRGRWPGNDYELLRGPYALGVDEISVDPSTCWNLAEPGQRGPAATLEYLSSLEARDGILHFAEGALT
ncbi:sucrose-6-phosphate hydrolase [Bradyrhizobium sp. 190]|uniref:sucrose-6-phosphate hydrolase n=1 Tax=Bradyrhizobium sp. 190 TaxID=2782658 RepID=UPI001FFA03D4|nr:sucrose-6-phosphate hydrolase [Bradyrhizobium sp. 190]